MNIFTIARNIGFLWLVASGGSSGAQTAPPATGKFYMVGMGTAPGLITVQAQSVIATADILMGEEGAFAAMWTELARGKQTREHLRNLRRFYGIDPRKSSNPEQRAQAEQLDKTRRRLIEKIASAVASWKVVASLQSGDPMMYGMTLFLELCRRAYPPKSSWASGPSRPPAPPPKRARPMATTPAA